MFKNTLSLKSKNISLMYIIHILGGFLFFLPIIALYFEESLFSVTNVAIIFAVEAIAMTLLEVPTGAIADLFGRKNSLIFSNVMLLVGLVFLYVGGSMTVFILYAIFNAFAQSLYSGTDQAILYDTLKDEKKEKHYKKVTGTYSALWPLGAAVGSIIGGYLATISLSLSVLLTFIPISIVLVLTFFLKEPKYEHEDHKNIVKHMVNSSKIIFSNLQLIILFLSGFILWGLGESMHRLISLFFAFKEIPIIYFGIISAFMFGFSSIGHYFSHFISEKIGNKKTLVLSVILTPLFLVTATLTTRYATAILWTTTSLFFGLRNPIINHLTNLEVTSSKRATVMSSLGFLNRLGIAIFAPLIGYFAEIYSINTSFKISAILMFIVPILYLFLKDKN